MPTPTPARQAVVDAIAGLLSLVRPDRVLRVAVDGPDAAVARYLPGQELYQRRTAPHRHADILIDNEQSHAPRILHWPDSG